MELIAQYWIPILVVAVIVAFFWSLKQVAKLYVKVSPNEVAVVSGRTYKVKVGEAVERRGFKTVTGGGFLLIPFLEKIEVLSLSLMTFDVEVKGVPDANGALVNVLASANVKIRSDESTLPLAVERFLGKSVDAVKDAAKQNMEGNLRAMIGTLSIEELIKNRESLQKQVLGTADADLRKIGLAIDLLTVKEISDPRGYIDSLGKKQTAEVVKNATIGEAEARRDAQIKSAQAKQEGEVAQAGAEQAISDAQRARDTQIADNLAKTEAAKARVPLVAAAAAAEEQKFVNEKEVEAQKARARAETDLQAALRERNEAEQNATTIVKANAEREARTIRAEAERAAAEREGEAKRLLQAKEAEGRIAIAKAVQTEGEAEAAANKARLLAEAEGSKAQLLAEAEGQKAKLLAEAEGILKKAEAFKQLDEAGRFLLIIEALPPVIAALGNAGKEILGPLGDAIGKGLGNIDELRIIDMGGAQSAGGKNVLGQFVNLPVETIFGIKQKIEAAGIMPMVKTFLARAGISFDDLEKQLNAATAVPAASTAADADPVAPKTSNSGVSKKEEAPKKEDK